LRHAAEFFQSFHPAWRIESGYACFQIFNMQHQLAQYEAMVLAQLTMQRLQYLGAGVLRANEQARAWQYL